MLSKSWPEAESSLSAFLTPFHMQLGTAKLRGNDLVVCHEIQDSTVQQGSYAALDRKLLLLEAPIPRLMLGNKEIAIPIATGQPDTIAKHSCVGSGFAHRRDGLRRLGFGI